MTGSRPPATRLLVALLAAATPAFASATAPADELPDLLLITVDTLRADRLSSAGYPRATSPRIDALLASGARFREARTVEPLTNPALTSLLSSVPPDVHGATRNGIPARPDLATLPAILGHLGYDTAAILGNWTLRDPLSGLARHWDVYRVIESRKRWFGLLKGEAVASELVDAAGAWMRGRRRSGRTAPAFLWVHFVEPHAPYRFQAEAAARLGIEAGTASAGDRYDTEIAAADAEIGRLLELWAGRDSGRESLIVFAADHGEAFGEDGVHGHGRVLHEATLRVPLGFVWSGHIRPAVIAGSASLLDVAPTVLGLLGWPAHPAFRGFDRSRQLLDGGDGPDSALCLQAHRGAVQSQRRSDRARRAGLLEVGSLAEGELEVLAVESDQRRVVALEPDPARRDPARPVDGPPSARLEACLQSIRAGLERGDRMPAPELDDESVARLRALGYLD